jgi:hypothetical protein
MISTTNPAFEFLRKYKPCEQHTEDFVMKKSKKRISQSELITVFEKGVAGEYGKFIQADPQTLLGWIDKYVSKKNSSQNYLELGLLDKRTHVTSPKYHSKMQDWEKEANRCFTAFINGVSEENFHPHVYDRMLLDHKITMNAYLKYFKPTGNETEDVMAAKQKILRDCFIGYKKLGYTVVYFIPPEST